ncbi:hypothetical protein Pyrfu_0785 [Pyrolobus fumarii 1A]|uniref:Uncharacterized protein n=1 Tax=Pyrolobus fumarii (strain DSM 11204 / 1A) TaxID=694429 RepID=G0EDG9_PYRF1|nr:hypothetical protein [Pyrolobus fumarii]AEM38654.1 hypothetical protein Pyrfu_0785 [Pyrolobus fumarii 1A]
MSGVEARARSEYSWVSEHVMPRIVALFDLVLNLRVLLKRRDVGEWLVTWLLYLGIVAAALTAIIVGATRGVIYAANTVLRPHALPIISPELEKFFISWPQLAIGMGYHAHIITGLYFAAPAYTAAVVGAYLLRSKWLERVLFPRGYTGRDILDHLLFIATLLTAWAVAIIGPYLASMNALAPGLQALAPHIAVGSIWLIYSLVFRGLAYRTIGTALALISKILVNRIPKTLADLTEDPWASLLLK